MTTSVLQQTLRGLCHDTGWCYAVFWKLKRQIRTVLTWEDGVYEPPKATEVSTSSVESLTVNASMSSALFGQQMSGDHPSSEDQIELSVAKMSIHVYSVGEGTIGRVAFTNKHQWVFSSSQQAPPTDGVSNTKRSGRPQPEKYPAGWQDQFTAGIKTIAVIAVPQGVIQLGSTQTIAEDWKLVEHVKALFGTLQNVPGAFLSDIVSEAQRGGGVHGLYPMAVQVPQVPPVNLSMANMNVMTTPMHAIMNYLGPGGAPVAFAGNIVHSGGVGRLPMLLASRQPYSQQQHIDLPGGVMGLPLPYYNTFASEGFVTQLPFPVMGAPVTLSRPNNAFPAKDASALQPWIPSTTKLSNIGVVTNLHPTNTALPPQTGAIRHPTTPKASISADFTHFPSANAQLPLQTGVGGHHLPTTAESSMMAGSVGLGSAKPSNHCQAFNNVSTNRLADNPRRTGIIGNFSLGTRSSNMAESTHTPIVKSNPSCTGVISHFPLTIRSSTMSLSSRDTREPKDDPPSLIGATDYSAFASSSNLLGMAPHSSSTSILANIGTSCSSSLDKSLDLQIGDIEQLAVHLESADNHEFPNDLPIGGECIDARHLSSLLCEELLDGAMQPLKPCLEVPGEHLRGVRTELDDFDDFIALLAREQENKDDGLSMRVGTPSKDNTSDALPSYLEEEIVQGVPPLDIPSKQEVMASAQDTRICAEDASRKAIEAANIKATLSDLTGNLCGRLVTPKFVHEAPSTSPSINEQHKQNDMHETYLPWPSSRRHHVNPCFQSSSFDNDKDIEGQLANRASLSGAMPRQNGAVVPAYTHDELFSVGKKRARPGEPCRPRPKDRQQVQDRVRELRDIIPDAAKCSIDALLEKTIKYINILQTASQDGDKWKQSCKLKDIISDKETGLGIVDIDASWAVEFGEQGRGCPIVVENLSQPRQMLVEMLCEDRGIFLEIADSIKGLGLRILKGVMEARESKIWARFIVEAVQDVHRVQVLWSLMQLLEPSNGTNLACPPKKPQQF